MADLGPKELLGRTVVDLNGDCVGLIRGCHQLHFPGGFEEVAIENGGGLVFARIDELAPDSRGFVLHGCLSHDH